MRLCQPFYPSCNTWQTSGPNFTSGAVCIHTVYSYRYTLVYLQVSKWCASSDIVCIPHLSIYVRYAKRIYAQDVPILGAVTVQVLLTCGRTRWLSQMKARTKVLHSNFSINFFVFNIQNLKISACNCNRHCLFNTGKRCCFVRWCFILSG